MILLPALRANRVRLALGMLRTVAIVLLATGCRAADAAPAPPAPGPASPPAAAAVRLPLPASEAVAAAAKELRGILRDDFASRDPAMRAALARKLIELGASGEAAARCAALREAEAVAGKLGDAGLADQAAAAVAAAFDVALADERLEALGGCVAGCTTVDAVSTLVETFLAIAEEAVAGDSYDLAERAAQQADAAARRIRDPSLAGRTRATLQRMRALGDEWRKIGPATDLLGQPDVAAAGRRGRFLCLWKGDWGAGLPALAKSDDALASAAAGELDATTPAAQLAAGLAWAELAAKQRGDPRDALLLHAAGLLRLALPGLEVLDRARAEKRLADLDKQLGGRRSSIPPGAVLYLSCDRDAIVTSGGRTQVQDISGSGHPGNLGGGKPVQGAWGGAVEFAAPGDAIDCGSAPALRITGSMTVSMWLRPTALGDSRRNPYHKSYGSEGTITLERNGTMNFYWGVSGHDEEGHYQAVNSGFALTTNTWTHITVVRDLAARTVTWFRNGKRATSVPAEYPAAKPSDAPLLIGRGYAGVFAGMIDEFGLWARPLRDQEVAALYAATAAGR